MISRKSTKLLAYLYEDEFSQWEDIGSGYLREKHHIFRNQIFYDFLYERDYDSWFMNLAKAIRQGERDLIDFILKLHTGESIVSATTSWTWEQRQKQGHKLLIKLAQDIISHVQSFYSPAASILKDFIEKKLKLVEQLILQLELDGYTFKNGKLYYSEADVLDVEEEQGILRDDIKQADLNNQQTIFHHLDKSEENYLGGKWDDSISQLRKFMESILQEVAYKISEIMEGKPLDDTVYKQPGEVRKYLQKSGLIEGQEKEALGSTYSLLSGTGGHPYIAKKDQARLLRHLALTYSQFIIMRLQGFIDSKIKAQTTVVLES